MTRDTAGQRDEAAPRSLRITASLSIPLDELEWHFSGSGGPGGQHANTANTRAELRFDVLASHALGPRQRARILDRLGAVIRVVASDERSQLRNRELALERFRQRLVGALKIETPRRPTAPTLGGQRRRLQQKHELSERKRMRHARDED